MKVQYCSDLHLEFPHNAAYIENYPIEPMGDVLVLAGDITSLRCYDSRKTEKDFFKQLSKQFEQVFWICGNHEYYNSWDVAKSEKPFCVQVAKNVQLLNNSSIIYRNVRFVFSTLWSYIDQMQEFYIGRSMSDFDLIRYAGRTLTPAIYTNKLHKPALEFLKTELGQPNDLPTVVITHHLPSLQCVHARHKGSELNAGFASDLDNFILETQPNHWIYGHSHSNMPDFQIGQTQLITNQLGYCNYGENKDFRDVAYFEI